MTQSKPIEGTCPAVLNVRGEHFPCDLPAPHPALAHNSRAAQAIWTDNRDRLAGEAEAYGEDR